MAETDFVKQVNDMLQKYYKAIDDGIGAAVDKTLADGMRMIDGVGGYRNKTGRYRQSFRIDKSRGRAGQVYGTLYNKRWPLTHLLEEGHNIVARGPNKKPTINGVKGSVQNSSAVLGRTRAFPHWTQTEAFMDAEFERLVEQAIEKARG